MNTAASVCRSCGAKGLKLLVSLGTMPLANALLTREQLKQPEPKYSLDLAFCPQCTLVQITETVPPEALFRDYLYFSSYSDTMLQHAEQLAHRLTELIGLNNSSLVVELGSNDGYLLQYFVANGIPVLGIEPARNVAKAAEEKGIRTVSEFFGEKLASALKEQGERADVMIANNVLAHVADLGGFVRGIHLLLKEDGECVIEVPYVKEMIDRCEFDTIYHEHLCYFSLTALDKLFKRVSMTIADVERIPIHGGSLRVYVAHEGHAQQSQAVRALLHEETEWGVYQPEFYQQFGYKVEQVKISLRALLNSLKRQGMRIAAYGAAAKGAVLLNYCGIGTELIDFVADRSPHKQGHYMPGIHLPIHSPSRLLEDMPDYTLLLAWNLADEVFEQQAKYRQRGGKFIVPIPEVRIV